MCYDMSFFSNIRQVSDYLGVPQNQLLPFEPTYHKVAQSFCKWPVAINEEGYKLKLFEWGLIAEYMNTPEKITEYRYSMANARCEKIIRDQRSVWYRIRHQRCLVFTTGFFEHRDIGNKKKLPYFIKVKNESVFCFAGLYNYSPLPDPETGEVSGTFAIITKPANSLMAKIHNAGLHSQRMPVILSNEDAHRWLSPDLDDRDIEELLQKEFPSDQMEAWPVHTIRTRKADDQSVIEKLPEGTYPAL